MMDDVAEEKIKEMEKIFGPLPNPIHEPKRSLFYLKMYNHYLKRKNYYK